MDKPTETKFEEPKFERPEPVINLESIIGMIPQVTADPTWTPKLFKDGFALGNIAGTRKLYIYDFTANTWYKVSLTAV